MLFGVCPHGFSDRFRRKSRIVQREVTLVQKDKNGKEKREKRKFTEKEVVYWSEAFYKREMHEHRSFLDFVDKLRANPAGFRVSASQPKSDAGGDLKWSYGMSGERLSKALREWQALRHPGDQYQMVNSSGEDICRVLAALDVNLRPAIYTKGGVSALKAKVKVF